MAKNTEIELKLLVSKENLKKLLALDCVAGALREGSMQKRKLVSSYYDTEDLAFKRQGIAYRVRSKGDGTYEATVKTSIANGAGLSERVELNMLLTSARAKLEGFAELGLGYELSEMAPNGVSKLFTVTVQRTTYILDLEGAVAELAIDHGKITAGKDSVDPIDEVEIELLEGDKGALLALAAEIAAQVPVFVEKRSKFVRGLALRGIMVDAAPVQEKLGAGPAKNEILGAVAVHGEQLLNLQQELQQNISDKLLKGLKRELLVLRSLQALAGVAPCELLEDMLKTVADVRRLLALQVLWQRIMAQGKLERSSLQKKLSADTKASLELLQALAAGGRLTAIVFGLQSLVYRAELGEENVDARIKAAVKTWQQDVAADSLSAAENIGALARICTVKAASKAAEAVKKQRRQLNKQDVLAVWQEDLQAICETSTSKLMYREVGMILGYLLAKNK
ncbi:MAG: CYTH domain-containing protein [Phascolarctobacterium sp.]